MSKLLKQPFKFKLKNKDTPARELTKYEDTLIKVFCALVGDSSIAYNNPQDTLNDAIQGTDKIFDHLGEKEY